MPAWPHALPIVNLPAVERDVRRDWGEAIYTDRLGYIEAVIQEAIARFNRRVGPPPPLVGVSVRDRWGFPAT